MKEITGPNARKSPTVCVIGYSSVLIRSYTKEIEIENPINSVHIASNMTCLTIFFFLKDESKGCNQIFLGRSRGIILILQNEREN